MKQKLYFSIPVGVLGLVTLVILLSSIWNTASGAGISKLRFRPAETIPTISILSVNPDESVTIQTYNFPANDTFDVYMNTFGTRGEGGTKVDSFDSGSGGSFTKTFSIPSNLKGLDRIAIRLEGAGTGYYSFNWFWNASSSSSTVSSTATPVIPVTGGDTAATTSTLPTFTITSVSANQSVSITTSNFPANDTFNVLMNTFGTRGEGGVQVASVQTSSGGSLSFTFDIPASLKGLAQIAIRLESPTSGYYTFNWFNNQTGGTTNIPVTGGTSATVTPAATARPVPTFRITHVNRDDNITIQTANFPAGETFVVRMGNFGTRGVDGIEVGTFNSGDGGSQSASFDIPSELDGKAQIAVRLDSNDSGAYSFNWFWNSTYP